MKKGYDFLKGGNSFQNPDAVVALGVGKNMVSAIQYWMMSFYLLDSKKKLTQFSHYIFGETGKDPFIEDIATLCLLHYFLVKTSHASIYSLFFNEFRKEKSEFTRKHLMNYLIRKGDEVQFRSNASTIEKDITVFLNTYLKADRSNKDLSSGLLVELEMIGKMGKNNQNESIWFRSSNTEKMEIPTEVLLFCILDNEKYADSISLHDLSTVTNSIGSVFAISSGLIVKKIEEITRKYDWITYADDAGIRELQFKNRRDKWEILDDYYGK